MKNYVSVITGAVGGAVAMLFGGWTKAMTTLVILMLFDYIAGVVVAAVFNNSPKSESGGIKSSEARKGLIRKIFVLCLVAIANCMDGLLNTTYIKDMTAIAFCTSEIMSIIENAGLMGIPIPGVIQNAFEVLKKKGDNDENDTGNL